jgi:hypothetical protein
MAARRPTPGNEQEQRHRILAGLSPTQKSSWPVAEFPLPLRLHNVQGSRQAQPSAFEVCGLTGLIRYGAPTQATQISTPWQWSHVNEHCGMSAAQQMRRGGLTIASWPLDSEARI